MRGPTRVQKAVRNHEGTPSVTLLWGHMGCSSFCTSASFCTPACWLSLLLLLPSSTIPLRFTPCYFHSLKGPCTPIQISGEKNQVGVHSNSVSYTSRASHLRQTWLPGPSPCMLGNSQRKSIQDKMLHRCVIYQKVRTLEKNQCFIIFFHLYIFSLFLQLCFQNLFIEISEIFYFEVSKTNIDIKSTVKFIIYFSAENDIGLITAEMQ